MSKTSKQVVLETYPHANAVRYESGGWQVFADKLATKALSERYASVQYAWLSASEKIVEEKAAV